MSRSLSIYIYIYIDISVYGYIDIDIDKDIYVCVEGSSAAQTSSGPIGEYIYIYRDR